MENNVEIILMGSINRLANLFDESLDHDCINMYREAHKLIIISHKYNELLHFMKTSKKFTDREYVLKELNEEEENKYLALFAITDEETFSNVIYEELKNLPTTKYPREE